MNTRQTSFSPTVQTAPVRVYSEPCPSSLPPSLPPPLLPLFLLASLRLSPTECYLSEKDKKTVTVTAKSETNQHLCVTRLKVKVQSGDQGAQGGLIFLTEEDPSTFAEEKLKAFESWTEEDYKSEEKR